MRRHAFTFGLATIALLGGAAFLGTAAASASAAATGPSDRVALPSSSGQVRASTTAPPLTLANFAIVPPGGTAQAVNGSLTVPFGGVDTWQVMTMGYVFDFNDFGRGLTTGQYSTTTDAQVDLQNDPYCRNPAFNVGTFEIDQATYDSSGTLQFAAVQFDFFCADGTEVFGTFAYNILNTTPNQGYYVYDTAGDVTGFGNDSYLLYLGTPATLNLNAPIIDMVPTPDGNGDWMLSSDRRHLRSTATRRSTARWGGQRLNAHLGRRPRIDRRTGMGTGSSRQTGGSSRSVTPRSSAPVAGSR